MGEETLLVVVLGTLHLLGVCFATLLLLPLLREENPAPWAPKPGEDQDNGGGNDRVRPEPPRGPSSGGLPLPDAVPARVRLRSGERLADLVPLRDRRPAHAPAPQRTPARSDR